MRRPLLIVGLPAAAMLIVLIVFTTSFRVHVGGPSIGSADLQGIFVHRDGKVCLAGPVTMIRVWLAAHKLKNDPAREFGLGNDNATFDVHWVGTDRHGWTDGRDPAVQATWRALEHAGWPCRGY